MVDVQKRTLFECGFQVFWGQQNMPGNFNYVKSSFILSLRLQEHCFSYGLLIFLIKASALVYRMYKVNLTFENYLIILFVGFLYIQKSK